MEMEVELLPPPSPPVPRVRLRLQYPLATTLEEPAALTIYDENNVNVLQLQQQVKAYRSKVWKAAREKGEAERKCRLQLSELTTDIKARARGLNASLGDLSQKLDGVRFDLRQTNKQLTYYRKVSYDQGKLIDMLKNEKQLLADELKKHKSGQHKAEILLRRVTTAKDKMVKALETEKTAYRMRAEEATELKALRHDVVHLRGVQAESEHLQAELSAASAAAAGARKEADILKEELDASLTERKVEAAAQRVVGDYLSSEMVAKESELEALRAGLAQAQQAVADMKERTTSASGQVSLVLGPARARTGASDRSGRRYRKEERDYLTEMFTERAWRGEDVAAALEAARLLPGIFDSKPVCFIVV